LKKRLYNPQQTRNSYTIVIFSGRKDIVIFLITVQDDEKFVICGGFFLSRHTSRGCQQRPSGFARWRLSNNLSTRATPRK